MCGRYFFNLNGKHDEILKLKQRVEQLGLFDFQQGEVFPTQSALVVSEQVNGPDLDVKAWGIRGYHNQLLINARMETVHQRPLFAGIAHQRCLIICNGFYEWIKHGTKKDKIYIQKKGHPVCYMAGIYNDQNQFVILTGESSDQMASYHARTPLLIEKNKLHAYLKHAYDPMVDNEDFVFNNVNRKEGD